MTSPSITPVAYHVKPGPKTYLDQMSVAEFGHYRQRLDWIQDQEKAGHLRRGWKTVAMRETGYSQPMVSNVLTGKIVSPPVLDACYAVALKLLGIREPKTPQDNIQVYTDLRQAIGSQIDQIKQDIEDADLILMEKMAELQTTHEQWKAQQTRNLADLENRYERASSALEGFQLAEGAEMIELVTRDGGELPDVEQLIQDLQSGQLEVFRN